MLEGPQGSGKSSALRILAGIEDTFSDQELVHLDAKAQQEAVRGKWICEIAELAGLNRADAERIKSFFSRTHDRARPAYGHKSVDQPRRCVFVGTTNERNYLKDATGNRRFWPVTTTTIDLIALARDRDQLWAEAVALEKTGETLFLSDQATTTVVDLQDERRDEDPWQATIAERTRGEVMGDEERIGTADLLCTVLAIEPARQTRHDALRLRDCMRRLGWVGPVKLRIKGIPVWGYRRPAREALPPPYPPF